MVQSAADHFSTAIIVKGGTNVLPCRRIQYQSVPGAVRVTVGRARKGIVNATAHIKPRIAAVRTSEERNDVISVVVGRIKNPDLKKSINARGGGLDQSVEPCFVMKTGHSKICSRTPANATQ